MGGELGVGGVTESKGDAPPRRKGVSCFSAERIKKICSEKFMDTF